MDDIEYKDSIKNVDWQDVSNAFLSVGWGTRSPSDLFDAFQASSFVRIAYFNEKIVGFGRTIDDGKYYASIVDLVILPDFQGKGIGSEILKQLGNELTDFKFTTLTAAPGKSEYYLKQGWLKQKSAFILPRSEKQKTLHAEE